MFYLKDEKKMGMNGQEAAKTTNVVGAGVCFSFLDNG